MKSNINYTTYKFYLQNPVHMFYKIRITFNKYLRIAGKGKETQKGKENQKGKETQIIEKERRTRVGDV